MRHTISATWNCVSIPRHQWVSVDMTLTEQGLDIDLESPFYGDPRPPGPAGPTDELWMFEVVEIFVSGEADRYLEVELSPHGHYLVLLLNGRRNIEKRLLPLDYGAAIAGSRWRGHAFVPASYLPCGALRGNVYAIHGAGDRRTYLARYPLGGDSPDFHRLEDFGPLFGA